MKLNLFCALSTVGIVESFTPHLPKYNAFKKPLSTTQQCYYKTDQPFDERIEIVRNNYETLKNEFIKQIKDPDIQRAEKIVLKSFKAAEQNAESFLSNQLEASPEAARILDEIKGMKVAESLSEAAATSATAVSNAISALQFSSEGLSDSIKSAEKVLESISSSVASGSTEGIDTDTLSMLKSSATEIKNSLQSVESIAKTITKVSESDEVSLSKLGSVGESLIKSFKKLNNEFESSPATTVGVAKTEPGGTPTIIIDQDSAAQSAISSLDTVAQDVIKEMEASEEIAKVVTKAAEADAAIAASSLESKANDVIENIMAVEKVVKEVSAGSIKNEVEAVAALKEITGNAVSKVQEDENTVEAVVNAIGKDASTDALAVNKLKELDDSVTEMIKAAEVVVKNLEKVDADTITALKAQATSVAECAECAIKEIENAQLTVEGSQEVVAAVGAVAVKDAKPLETVQTDTLEKNVASITDSKSIKSDTATSSSSSSSSDEVVVSKVNEPVTSKAPEEISKTTGDSVAKTDNEHTNNVLVENSGKSDKVQDDANLSAMNTKSSDSTTEANLHNKAEVSKTIEKSTVMSEDNVDSDLVNKNVVVKSDVTKDDSTLVVENTDDDTIVKEASKAAKPEKSVDISSDADNTVDKTKLATTNSEDKAVVQEKLENPKGEESIEKVVATNNESMNDRNTVDDTIRNEISKSAETDKSPVEVTVASDNTKVVVDENNLIAKQKTSEESSVVQEKLQSDQVKESVESAVKRKEVLEDDNHLVAQKSNVEATTSTTSGDEKVILESKSLTENTVDAAKGDAPIESITNNVLASDGKVANSDSIINTERIPEPIQTIVQNMKVVDSADANTLEHDVVKDHFIDTHTQVAESAASLTKEILQATDSTVTHEAIDKVVTSTADVIVDSTQTATTEVASIIANLFFL